MYSKTHWRDRVVDSETGEVIQEGTFMSAEHFNNMENGIAANDAAISGINNNIDTIETTLDTGVGTTITLTVNSSTFVMKLALKNSEGNILSESEVDLPIESMIVNAEYVEATKSLVLTLQSGSKVTVPLSALINGLVNDNRKVAGMDLKKDITVSEMVTALGVDKKVNKSSVSSSAETTSVINVTDAKAQMAMVAKISGKTVKSKNLFKKYTNLNGYTVSSETYNGYPCITSSSAWLGAFDSSLILKSGVTYYVYAMVKSDLAGAIISIYGKNSEGNSVTLNSVTIGESNTWTRLHKVYTPSSDIIQLRIESRSEAKTTIAEFMVVESSESINYEPYFEGLHSAPVESVISVGKNIAEFSPMTKKAKMNIYGAIEKGKFLKAGKYTLSYQSDYTAFLQVWLVDNMTQIVKDGSAKAITFTLPSDGKYSIYFYKDTTSEGGLANANIRNLQLEKSNEATPYTQHFKTTLLIPDSDRNLPCFGYGIDETVQNIRDYENGTYTQMVAEVDLGDLSWVRNGDNGNRFYCDISTMKASSSITNGICSLYNRNPVDWKSLNDKDFCLGQNINSKGANIAIRDDSYTDATTFKTAMKGVKLVYELATPVITDCSDILHPIRVETGGTITLQNEHSLDMTNIIMYKKEVSLNG